MSEVTRILSAIESGEPRAAEELLPLVYGELRRLAAHKLSLEQPGQTLQPTALVHEAWLRLVREEDRNWNGSRHFFNAAAEAMRRILIDIARRKRSVKRGGDLKRTDLDEFELPAIAPPEELLALDEALTLMEQAHPEEALLVKLRYFMGVSQEEAARMLGISRGTVNNRWAFARAWLYQTLHPNEHNPP
jgi:RNA polymerase sigma factor (TIGR02999 family)